MIVENPPKNDRHLQCMVVETLHVIISGHTDCQFGGSLEEKCVVLAVFGLCSLPEIIRRC